MIRLFHNYDSPVFHTGYYRLSKKQKQQQHHPSLAHVDAEQQVIR